MNSIQYFGGKAKIAKEICAFINNRIGSMDYVEPFCGSCKIISGITGDRNKYAYDSNRYLIEMFESVQDGWAPPTKISEEEYVFFKDNKEYNPSVTGFVGFACSFSGKWFGGYARNSRGDNFAKSGSNSLVKQRESILGVVFSVSDYKDLSFDNKFIYCDPPYKNTTQYNGCEFNYNEYIHWVKEQSKNNVVLCSEYKPNVPVDAKIVWEKESKKEIRDKNDKRVTTTEVLWTYNNL